MREIAPPCKYKDEEGVKALRALPDRMADEREVDSENRSKRRKHRKRPPMRDRPAPVETLRPRSQRGMGKIEAGMIICISNRARSRTAPVKANGRDEGRIARCEDVEPGRRKEEDDGEEEGEEERRTATMGRGRG
jgi:hypothetical protein